MSHPPLLPTAPYQRSRRDNRIILLGCLAGMLVLFVVFLRLLNLLIPFRVPTGAMSPAVRAGDHLFMEGLSYRFGGEVERGDIIVFKTEEIRAMQMPGPIFIKRLAGLPGERVRIEGGKLFINDQLVSLKNAEGEIRYGNMGTFSDPNRVFTVPENHYFVLGDASTNSYDSRYWGTIPREAVMGRAFFSYWPPSRMGRPK